MGFHLPRDNRNAGDLFVHSDGCPQSGAASDCRTTTPTRGSANAASGGAKIPHVARHHLSELGALMGVL